MSIANAFDLLEVEGVRDGDVSFRLDDVVQGAMEHIPEGGINRQLVGDVVKAVVAALLPVMQSIAAQVSPKVSVQKVQASLQKHDVRLDEMEQYSRRDNIVLRGVPEKEGENTNDVVIEVSASTGIKVVGADISTSHRIGRPQPNRSRPIVARFVRRDLRTDILRNKRKLRDSQHKDIMVSEHLAPGRAKLLHAVKQDDQVERVWTIDGKVHCILKGDPRKQIIHGPDDLFRRLGWSEDRLKQSGLFTEVSS
eukprot:XP_011665226.1 PREDICTED: uncharacterized protein LOC105438737 [Strongylocentrotus purpuratus]